MEAKDIYQKIMDNAKQLDKLYIKNKELTDSFNKAEFLDTFLLGNSSDKRKELQEKINQLQTEEYTLSAQLREIGYVVDGRDYSLVLYNEAKVHVGSALYKFLVQY